MDCFEAFGGKVKYKLRQFAGRSLVDWVLFGQGEDAMFVKIGQHAKERMIKRYVPSKAVIEALIYGEWFRQWRGLEENFHVNYKQMKLILTYDCFKPSPNRLRVKTLYYLGHTLKSAKILAKLNGTSIYEELELIRA